MKSQLRLILLVVGFVVFGGLVAAGWFFLAVPYLARVKKVEEAEAQAASAQAELDGLRADAKRLKPLTRRSLPAGPEYPDDPKRTKREYASVARDEYEQALTKVLKDAGARNSTINFVDAESNSKQGIPQIDPAFKASRDSDPIDYLAYTPIVFRIDMPKTDLATVAEVLRRYYSLDLLQQITHLSIKQAGAGELGEDKRPLKDRNDLKVEITTRAIIVNGAERRRTLTPAPSPVVGLVGGIGGASYEQSPGVARKMLPEPVESILAMARRDYGQLPGKDLFHGPLPTPPKPEEKRPIEIIDNTPPPKPDFREYIVYTTYIHEMEGDEHVLKLTVKDKINKEDYDLTITQAGEKVKVVVYKWEYWDHKVNVEDRKKKAYRQDTLEISKSTMSNKNNFTVYGVDTDGSLILGEKPTGLSPVYPDDKKPVGGGFGGGFGGRPSSKTPLPPADPKAAVIGGMVVTAPKPEKFYRWESGKSLKQIVELSKPEAESAIKRAQTRFLPAATSTTPPQPPEVKVTDKP